MSWTNPPTRFTKTVSGDIEKQTKRFSLILLRNLVLRSPIDSGRFRNNWLVGLNQKDGRQLKSTGNQAVQRGSQKIKSHKAGGSVWISNNLPYARRLNEGWSQQAPANFVEKAIARVTK